MTNAIEIQGLVRSFGDVRAVDSVDLVVPRGSACALLGPNGAGKSTVLRILAGLLAPDAGRAAILGQDTWNESNGLTQALAYVPEAPFLPEWMTLDQLCSIHRSVFERWDDRMLKQLLERFELPMRARVGTLSKGQNRRAHLILALCQGADLLLLDEPGSGLDVEARRSLLSALADWMAIDEQRTVVLSTHLVTDVERFADRVAVIAKGRCVLNEDLDDMRMDVKAVQMPRRLREQLAVSLDAAGILNESGSEHSADVVVRRFRALEPALRNIGPGDVIVSEGESGDSYVGTDGACVRVSHLGLEDAFLALVREASEPSESRGASR